jgi:hypothetical protein
VQQVKAQLGLEVRQGDCSIEPIFKLSCNTDLTTGLEGYFKTDRNTIDFHGESPSRRGFSFKYSVSLGPDPADGLRLMLSVAISPDDAVDLEAVLIMDQREPASASTYYSHDIFLTHIAGSCPMISLPSCGFSFMLAYQEEYNKLTKMVGRYLDSLEDSALAARRERTLRFIAGGVPKTRALLVQFQYPS